MSDQVVKAETAAAEPVAGDGGAVQDRLPDDHPLVKAYQAEKAKARESAKAVAELAKLKEASMSESEKIAHERDTFKAELEELRAESARNAVAVEFGLSSDDAKLLAGITDRETMKGIAKRLSEASKASSAAVPAAGGAPAAPGDDLRSWASAL